MSRLALPHLLVATGLLAWTAASPGSAVPTTAAITAADLRSRVFLITDDSTMGRETGSKGSAMIAEYVAAEFKRFGLQPKGENGGWFQVVPFWQAVPAATSLSIPGGATLQLNVDYLVPGLTGRPSAGPVPVVYGGSVNDVSSWISAEQAAGRVVLLDVRPDANGRRDVPQMNGIIRAVQFAGATAIAVARFDLPSRSAAAQTARQIPRADSSMRTPGAPALIVVTDRVADLLMGGSVAAAKPGEMGRTLQGDMTLRWQPVAYPARNVIGVLPGRDPALRGQYVSLSAHSDHVGICSSAVDHDSMRAFLHVLRPMGADTRTWNETPEATVKIRGMLDSMRKMRPARADSICNGADDDGSGTAALLELAEHFASLPMAERPRRSLLFVSHTAEERGLMGSKWFTDHPTVPVDSIVAEIDEDMIGRGTTWDLPKGGPTYLEVIGARRLSKEFGDQLEAANAELKVPFVFNYEFDAPGHPLQYYCRADHYSYARYGIPAVAFSRGEHLDYHQVTDEAQYLNYEDLLRVVTMVRNAAVRIGNADRGPLLDHPKGDPKARCVQ